MWRILSMSENYALHWSPLVSVGPFKFAASIQKYIEPYDLHFVEQPMQ
jgi:hypothetical protein